MCDEIMHRVSGIHPCYTPASLSGYRRGAVQGESFPAIRPDAAGCVSGLVYLDVPTSALPRLDEYEGEMYSREHVVVELEDGRSIWAETYVFRPAYYRMLSCNDWDYEAFLRHDKGGIWRS